MKLPRLNNEQFDQVNDIAKTLGIPLDQCPTCLAKPFEIQEGVWGFANGFYRYQDLPRDCDCELQIQLRKHYILAGIPDQYMRLVWPNFRAGNEDMKNKVGTYLEKWESFKLHGMGFEFSSPRLGVGKTFAATYIGKELVKRGESVYFIPFLEVVSALSRSHPRWEQVERRLYDSTVLILDEVVPPTTAPQAALFSGKLEELVRNRTNYNRINILTTNMPADEMEATYPRAYSVLAAKQIRVVLEGVDARQQHIADENLEMAMNGEIREIS